VKVKTDVILVVEIEGARVSIYPSGRILIHECKEEEAHRIVSKVYGIIRSEEGE